MITFWVIAILVFAASTYFLSRFTLKENRKQAGERIWKYGNGRSTYWRILCLCSFGLTVVIMFLIHWVGIPIQ